MGHGSDEAPDKDDAEQTSAFEDFDFCSDEGCFGVIGPDGHCQDCGRKASQKTKAPE